jgi:hypothetical protein
MSQRFQHCHGSTMLHAFETCLFSVGSNECDGKKAQSLKPFAIPFPAQIFKLHGDSQADLPSIRMNWMWQK